MIVGHKTETEGAVSIWASLKPLALELDIYGLAHHLCKFYEPRRVTLGNTRPIVEE